MLDSGFMVWESGFGFSVGIYWAFYGRYVCVLFGKWLGSGYLPSIEMRILLHSSKQVGSMLKLMSWLGAMMSR